MSSMFAVLLPGSQEPDLDCPETQTNDYCSLGLPFCHCHIVFDWLLNKSSQGQISSEVKPKLIVYLATS